MTTAGPPLRVILIGGTSHAGKSTLAAAWGADLGWPVTSTDGLGRHPGRPWRDDGRPVAPHVVAHYHTLSDAELLEANLAHYRGMWPAILALIESALHEPSGGGLVIEGSGCWPDFIAALDDPRIGAVWLTADGRTISGRIRTECSYTTATPAARVLIDRFTARTLAYDRAMAARLLAHGLPMTAVGAHDTVSDVLARCRERLFRPGRHAAGISAP